MNVAAPEAKATLEPDSFRVGRVAALQPRLDLAALAQEVMRTEDPAILHGIANVVRMWSLSRHDLPAGFCQRVQIRAVSRQPLSFVAVDAQFVERNTAPRREPFSGDSVANEPWPTDDLFQLVPLGPLAFPAQPVQREQPLPGQQSVHPCETCAGAGTQDCTSCEGAGNVSCPNCGGARRIVCSRCSGAGTHVGIRGNVINCRLCGTRGTLRCERCDGRGEIVCSRCGGEGRLLCATCQGSGKMLHRWALVETTSTRGSYDQHLSSPWPFVGDSLFDQSELIWSTEWNVDGAGSHSPPLAGVLPAHLAPRAEALVADSLCLADGLDPDRQRLQGLRVRVLATYVYRVEYEYAGRVESLLLGGLSSRVFTQRGAQRRAGWLRRAVTWCGRTLSRLWTGDEPALERTFFRSVQNGQVHIADSRCLMQSVRKLLPVPVTTTESGYAVIWEAADGNSQRSVVEITFEVDSLGQLLICFAARLGIAHRDCFPQMLEWNHRLSFGRLAVVVEPGAPQPGLLLVDRRPYETLTPSHCAVIVQAIAADLGQLARDPLFAWQHQQKTAS